MKKSNKYVGPIMALTSAIVTKYILQYIGVENISLKVQMIMFGVSPVLVRIFLFKPSVNKSVTKYSLCAFITYTISIIMIVLMMIVKDRNPEYFYAIRVPFVLILFTMFLATFIFVILGPVRNKK